MSLIFTPVLSRKDSWILPHIDHGFINSVRSPPTEEILQGLEQPPDLISDSGGFQIYKAKLGFLNGNETDHAVVIPGAGNRRHKGYQILDPICLCKMYGSLNIRYGFTLDYPIVDGSDEEYIDHLSKSYECAEIMFDCRPQLCPDTNLLIPLQFSTKEQLHNYYAEMSALCPDGYGFPVRGITCWDCRKATPPSQDGHQPVVGGIDGNSDDNAPDDNLDERLTDLETPIQNRKTMPIVMVASSALATNNLSFEGCLDVFISCFSPG